MLIFSTMDERLKWQKSRTLSDADMLNKGAEYISDSQNNPILHPTEEQYRAMKGETLDVSTVESAELKINQYDIVEYNVGNKTRTGVLIENLGSDSRDRERGDVWRVRRTIPEKDWDFIEVNLMVGVVGHEDSYDAKKKSKS